MQCAFMQFMSLCNISLLATAYRHISIFILGKVVFFVVDNSGYHLPYLFLSPYLLPAILKSENSAVLWESSYVAWSIQEKMNTSLLEFLYWQ